MRKWGTHKQRKKKKIIHTHTNTQAIFRACKGESNLSRRLWGCDNVPEGGIEAHTDWGFTCCCCCCFSFSRLIFYCRDNPPLLTSLPQPPPPSPHCLTVPNITVVFALTFFYFLWPKEIKETLTRGIIVYEKSVPERVSNLPRVRFLLTSLSWATSSRNYVTPSSTDPHTLVTPDTPSLHRELRAEFTSSGRQKTACSRVMIVGDLLELGRLTHAGTRCTLLNSA